MPKALITILLLIVSNIFMTFAWYGNLKLTELKINTSWPLILIILTSWGVAFFEYSFMIPANRIGSQINGGPFSLMQLKDTGRVHLAHRLHRHRGHRLQERAHPLEPPRQLRLHPAGRGLRFLENEIDCAGNTLSDRP